MIGCRILRAWYVADLARYRFLSQRAIKIKRGLGLGLSSVNRKGPHHPLSAC